MPRKNAGGPAHANTGDENVLRAGQALHERLQRRNAALLRALNVAIVVHITCKSTTRRTSAMLSLFTGRTRHRPSADSTAKSSGSVALLGDSEAEQEGARGGAPRVVQGALAARHVGGRLQPGCRRLAAPGCGAPYRAAILHGLLCWYIQGSRGSLLWAMATFKGLEGRAAEAVVQLSQTMGVFSLLLLCQSFTDENG